MSDVQFEDPAQAGYIWRILALEPIFCCFDAYLFMDSHLLGIIISYMEACTLHLVLDGALDLMRVLHTWSLHLLTPRAYMERETHQLRVFPRFMAHYLIWHPLRWCTLFLENISLGYILKSIPCHLEGLDDLWWSVWSIDDWFDTWLVSLKRTMLFEL